MSLHGWLDAGMRRAIAHTVYLPPASQSIHPASSSNCPPAGRPPDRRRVACCFRLRVAPMNDAVKKAMDGQLAAVCVHTTPISDRDSNVVARLCSSLCRSRRPATRCRLWIRRRNLRPIASPVFVRAAPDTDRQILYIIVLFLGRLCRVLYC